MPVIPYYDWIAHHAARRGDEIALVDLHSQRRISYGELHRRIGQLASHLAVCGIGKGDRVALLAANGPEYFELQFACGRLGAVMVPLNW